MILPGSGLTFILVELDCVDPLDDPPAPDESRTRHYVRLLAERPTAHLGLLLLEPSDREGRWKLLDGHHRREAYRVAGRTHAAAVAIEPPGLPHLLWDPGWVVPEGT